GLGHKAKKGWIQELNSKYRINFVTLQETKMESIDIFSIKALWGNSSFDYVFSPSVGFSGGILLVWDPNIFIKDSHTISDYFVAIRGNWIPSSTNLLIIYVYAPQELSEKRQLWDYIHHMTVSWNGLLTTFPSLSAICLDKHLSDHRPILMRKLNVDYGPTPFRFFHSWFDMDGFDKMVEDSWKNLDISDPNSMISLKKKLQALKISIKQWLKEAKSHSSKVKASIQKRLIDLDKSFDQGTCNDELLLERTNLLKELHDINSCTDANMRQKAKVRWAIEGDENSKYFHGVINKKRTQLAIRGIFSDGEWITEPPNQLDLERAVNYNEVKNAVWDCGTNKSPGPDGYTFEFYRRYWNIIDTDVVAAVNQFFTIGFFPPGCNSSFIALIPKCQDAKMVQYFRPISLIGSMYKIIAKILANRLSFVIPCLISETQSAFVSNRQILDGPFILNELLSWCKYKNHKTMIFKVDFEKAFDSVRWDYLDDVLAKFGFGDKWRGWIHGCLNNAKGSILVSSSPTTEFQFYKGLKQGDPLSPFLFILIMESLHLSFKNVENAGIYKGISIDNSFTLSHLFYVDDVVFVGKWSHSNILTIVNVLKFFFLASGLKINLHKSNLMGIGVPHNGVTLAAESLGYLSFSNPFKFPGVKVGGIMSRHGSWADVTDKLSSRLSKWKLKTLSIGGRLTLIKSVLTSLPLYHMSIFKCPL
nr:RNA-directed DNA polymerase, eukaryota [Tanacetum cinerariifolium]